MKQRGICLRSPPVRTTDWSESRPRPDGTAARATARASAPGPCTHSAARPGQSRTEPAMGLGEGSKRPSTTPRASSSSSRSSALGVRRLVERHGRLVGPLEEAVRHLHALGPGAQRGERVDEPLGGVRLARTSSSGSRPSSASLFQSTTSMPSSSSAWTSTTPLTSRLRPPAPGGREREGERQLGAHAARRGDPLAQLGARHALEHRRAGRRRRSARAARTPWRSIAAATSASGGTTGRAEVEPLEQPVHDRAAQQAASCPARRRLRLRRPAARSTGARPSARSR